MFNAFIGKHPQKPDQNVTMPVTVYAGSRLDGCQVKDYPWPADTIVTLIYRGEDKIIPNGKTVIQAGDTLLIRVNFTKTNHCYRRIMSAAHYANV